MKVLIICTEKLPVPPVLGGAIQTYIAGAVPTLKKHHSITILGREDETLPNEETKDGIHYVRIPGGLLETYREGVMRFINGNPTFDLIHIFNRPRLVNAVRQCAPKARIILSMHNDMFKPEKIDAEEGAQAISQVDKIITISNYIGHAITKYFPQAAPKLRTIYSGVDLNRFVPSYTEKGKMMSQALRKEHNLGSKKVILFAGRLSPNKGADVLVRALPALAEKHSNIALVLMGGKWFSDNSITDYIAYVRAMATRSPVPVIATGFISPDKIQEWFAAADVFVCPSQWEEPLARVHYEAMAAGLPIITTNRGGNTEVIEPMKNGLIVEDASNPEEFVNHLSFLLSKPQAASEMGKYGRKLAEQNYHWNRVVHDILAVWNEVEYNIKHNIDVSTGEYETNLEDSVTHSTQLNIGIIDTEQQEKEIKQKIMNEEVVDLDEIAQKRKRKKKKKSDVFRYRIIYNRPQIFLKRRSKKKR